MNQDAGQGLGHGDVELSLPFRPHDAIASHDPGRCPGLRNNAPLALKEVPDFSLGFSVSSKVRVSIEDRVHYIHGEPEKNLMAFSRGPTARDSLAQPNGLGLNVGESSGPTVRDPDQSHIPSDESGCGTGIGTWRCGIIAAFQAARRYCFPRTQDSSPGLRDNAPLALKEVPDFSRLLD